jgi:hypothetical protein
MAQKHYTMSEIKACNRARNKHFFDASTMRFFRSRVGDEVFNGPGGVYFVTSEQFVLGSRRDPRRYSVQRFNPRTCGIDLVGEFQQYANMAAAKRAARKAAGLR